jgi:outer membrane protein OmpA-like peptidoglycan-associated protein
MLASLLAVAIAAAPADDRVIVDAQNVYGQQGLLRTTSAFTGRPSLGLGLRFFVSPDFLLPDVADANTFLESGGAAGFSLFDIVELAAQVRAAANLNAARSAALASVGDLTVSAKAGIGFGIVGVGGTVRFGLPTRNNRVGFDFGNVATTGEAAVTVDLTKIGAPVRLLVNGGYTLQSARFAAVDVATNPYLLDGPDGALLALATQQWLYDSAQGGLGVEIPLPWVTPFVELWYRTAIGAADYDFVNDAWLTASPGLRVGIGGVRIDVAADIGVLGNAGAFAPDVAAVVAGQPLNPLWTLRVGISHSFGPGRGASGEASAPVVVGGSGSDGGGAGRGFARLEGCVKDEVGPVRGAVVAVEVEGHRGLRVLSDDTGCWGLPLPVGPARVDVTAVDHAGASATATLVGGETARADVVLASAVAASFVAGFLTNKDDESLDAKLEIIDGAGARPLASTGGAFEATVRPGRVVVVARADGYLAQGVDLVVGAGERRSTTLVLRKAPKKRVATLQADRIDTTARVPFEFKKARLQSTAEYLLDELADLLLSFPTTRLSIEAHTDVSEVADPAEAQKLTEARAQAVKDALVARGIAADRLKTAGLGTSAPLGPNDPKNRRVEFRVQP